MLFAIGTNIDIMAEIACKIKIAKTLCFFSYPPVNEPINPPNAIPIIGPITIIIMYEYFCSKKQKEIDSQEGQKEDKKQENVKKTKKDKKVIKKE